MTDRVEYPYEKGIRRLRIANDGVLPTRVLIIHELNRNNRCPDGKYVEIDESEEERTAPNRKYPWIPRQGMLKKT
ncbi:hypothetical protein A2685_01265 [Candidatus Woesebacteria bacterium RIFCSPHIGHO2_01_FULL_37_10]|uniref:Uncharacterized protein n=1 Tax=Candidatus Woesebacteria bacterium RIFCSPHIGHO2_01_FULL_37_10 TaxID=1802489 RepID=A0A1F7XZ75_9BACT|nr:MAG: hypothetical protein A2685_01265 [Candidatus Woesebacteria bacterium RIFCSPHIGHO2_01_FULL_37_10]